MRVSDNELETTVAKAARGAGWSPAVAAELGRAALTGPDAPAICLVAISDGLEASVAACLGALDLALADQPAGHPDAPEPLLRALALSRGAQHGCGFVINADDIQRGAAAAPAAPVVDGETWAALNALAAKSYVPASDASREAGAGAGLTDND